MHATGHSGTVLHHFGRKLATFPNLLKSCRTCMMIECSKVGFGGRCVPWVTLSQPGVGANTGNAIPPQPMHAFKPDKA